MSAPRFAAFAWAVISFSVFDLTLPRCGLSWASAIASFAGSLLSDDVITAHYHPYLIYVLRIKIHALP